MAEPIGSVYAEMRAGWAQFQSDMHKARDAVKNSGAAMQTSMDKAKKSFDLTGVSIAKLAGSVSAIYITKQLIQMADTYTLMDNKLKLVTNSADELKYVQEGLYLASLKSFTSYESSVALYSRFAKATQQLGVSQSELLRITETINKAWIISGATQEEAKNATIQLSQGMASGTLRGEELNSVLEQGGRIAQLLADYLKVNIGDLRDMAKEGKITSETIVKAFAAASKTIDEEFKKMEPTIDQAMTNLRTVFGRLLSDSNKSAEGTKSIATEILKLAETIDQNRPGIIELFTEIIAQAAQAVEYIGKIGEGIRNFSQGWAAYKRGEISLDDFMTKRPEQFGGRVEYERLENVLKLKKEQQKSAVMPWNKKKYAQEAADIEAKLRKEANGEWGPPPTPPPFSDKKKTGSAAGKKGSGKGGADKALKEANKEYEQLIKNIDQGEQAMYSAWGGDGGGSGADGIWRSKEEWEEAAKALVEYEKLMADFEDQYATNTANARNELEATMNDNSATVKDFADLFENKMSSMADAITEFATTGKLDFTDMVNSMIADLLKLYYKQMMFGAGNQGGGMFEKGMGFISGLFGGYDSSLTGQSVGYGDWTAGLGFHNGARVGLDAPTFVRALPSSIFANAPRFHSGLASDEFPAILQRGETVIPKGGGVAGPDINVIINNNNGSDVTQKATPNGNGGIDLEIMVDSAMSKNANRRSSQFNRTMRNNWGAKEPLVAR